MSKPLVKPTTPAKLAAPKSVRFKYVKSTKNCHRYEEVGADGNFIDQKAGTHSIGTLYVQKRLVGEQPTEFLSVAVTALGDAVNVAAS